MAIKDWQVVIGLEIHVQLNTKTKLFCACSTRFGEKSNQNTCPYCQGHPGVLPVLNREAVKKAIQLGLAIEGKINLFSQFERKNYFYPDLPKAYQISQLKNPICTGGHVEIEIMEKNQEPTKKMIGIERIQLEEDAGKLIHSEVSEIKESYVDLNRSSIPLIELVGKPDISSPEEAVIFFQTLRNLFLYLNISDCNMQEGSLRCDANISIKKPEDPQLGTRTEIKNMNTFKGIQAALAYEIKRQVQIKEEGGDIVQQTLLFDSIEQKTYPMRSKEEAQDYRYFMDPDLIPVKISQEEIEEQRKNLPELPKQKFARFKKDYQLSDYDTWLLTNDKALSEYFETALQIVPNQAKMICNWISTEVLSYLNRNLMSIEEFPVKPQQLGELVKMIDKGELTGKMGKEVFQEMCQTQESAAVIVERKGLKVVSNQDEVEKLVKMVLDANPEAVAKYRSGVNKVYGFFVGQIMKESKGQANPQVVDDLLKKLLQ